MNRLIEIIVEYPLALIFTVIISISTISMIIESIKKRKNRK
jgi:TctA family transporter